MVYQFDGYNYLIRLEHGERLVEGLQKFAKEAGVHAAWVNCVGAASELTLGYYDLDTKSYKWQTYKEMREINGLQGNIALDQTDQIVHHLHGSFSDRNHAVIGGHVKDLVVGATAELFVHKITKQLHREMDQSVGLQLLQLGDNA